MEDVKRLIALWKMSCELRQYQEARIVELAENSMKNAAKYEAKLLQAEEELARTKLQLIANHSTKESTTKMVTFTAEFCGFLYMFVIFYFVCICMSCKLISFCCC